MSRLAHTHGRTVRQVHHRVAQQRVELRIAIGERERVRVAQVDVDTRGEWSARQPDQLLPSRRLSHARHPISSLSPRDAAYKLDLAGRALHFAAGVDVHLCNAYTLALADSRSGAPHVCCATR